MLCKTRTRWLTCTPLLALLCVGHLVVAVVARDRNTYTCGSTSTVQDDHACLSQQYKWIPEAEHRCNIVRMTHSQLLDTFGPSGLPSLHPEPLVILKSSETPSNTRNVKFRTLVSRPNITSSLPPNFEVTLSSSNSFSAHRRTIPLTHYLEEISNNRGETTLDQLSNETWYLFGETYTHDWKQLLKNYTLPPCQTCVNDELVALSFGIGNRGSGVSWHSHGPGFSETIHGRKHWVLYPEKPPVYFDVNQTSRYWMEHVYTSLTPDQLPYECTLEPGDILYFPHAWYHATINLDPYTVFVSTFTMEHL
jgi:Cupin-like domain